MSERLLEQAERAVELARRKGAEEVRATVQRGRSVSISVREGAVEKAQESVSTSLSLGIFVDERFSTHSTSDLRPDALERFVERAVAMTRLLSPDPYRRLPEPERYGPPPAEDLELYDPAHASLDTETRIAAAKAAESGARAQKGPILSVTAGWSDVESESARVHSNGFSGTVRGTRFWVGAEVSVQDEGDRRPEDWHYEGARFRADLRDPEAIGARAAARALSRLGQRKLPSGTYTVVVENRVAGRLLGSLLAPLSGSALYLGKSFLKDRLGETIGAPTLSVVDDPLLPRGFGSRPFDGDGLPAARRTLFEGGVLRSYLLDVYYARKLGMEPTGGGTSNVVLLPGERDLDEIVAGVERGILVTGLLGGNADSTSGDFSHGIVGFSIEGGALAAPIGEMNIDGNHRDLWKRLAEVGSDPYPFSAMRVPTLRFDAVEVSGL
ncbi:MAG: TldD/PmbA family protein [Deltaproteobacteria bacterium]|nr:MAG: TldD/PmbA family protein [Deltaproteobacteria bacterium]